MRKVIVTESYWPIMSVYEAQTAIGGIKRIFEDNLLLGDTLRSGVKLDGRSPPYNDWKLDEKSLDEQLMKADCDNCCTLPFHKMMLAGT